MTKPMTEKQQEKENEIEIKYPELRILFFRSFTAGYRTATNFTGGDSKDGSTFYESAEKQISNLLTTREQEVREELVGKVEGLKMSVEDLKRAREQDVLNGNLCNEIGLKNWDSALSQVIKKIREGEKV